MIGTETATVEADIQQPVLLLRPGAASGHHPARCQAESLRILAADRARRRYGRPLPGKASEDLLLLAMYPLGTFLTEKLAISITDKSYPYHYYFLPVTALTSANKSPNLP